MGPTANQQHLELEFAEKAIEYLFHMLWTRARAYKEIILPNALSVLLRPTPALFIYVEASSIALQVYLRPFVICKMLFYLSGSNLMPELKSGTLLIRHPIFSPLLLMPNLF